jgi:hypothetical protein
MNQSSLRVASNCGPLRIGCKLLCSVNFVSNCCVHTRAYSSTLLQTVNYRELLALTEPIVKIILDINIIPTPVCILYYDHCVHRVYLTKQTISMGS